MCCMQIGRRGTEQPADEEVSHAAHTLTPYKPYFIIRGSDIPHFFLIVQILRGCFPTCLASALRWHGVLE